MSRLAAIAAALFVCAIGMDVAAYVSTQAAAYLETHRFVLHFITPACLFLSIGSGIVVAMRGKNAVSEDEPMSPVVRRDPKTGLRQL
jgi:hypothetical protein